MSDSPFDAPPSSSSPAHTPAAPVALPPENAAPQYATANAPQFAPLPLRARSALETLDVSVKIFKQFWKPLLAWAALASASLCIPFLNYVALVFAPPLMVGVVGCCLAAAVRGQNVGFQQCRAFTKPRYWSILAMHVLAGIVSLFVIACLTVLGTMMVIYALEPISGLLNNNGVISVIVAVIGSILLALFWGILFSAIQMWQGLTSVVACMEDEGRGSPMARAWNLLRKHWRHAINVMLGLNLGLLALWAILGGAISLLYGVTGLRDALNGFANSDSGVIGLVVATLGSMWFVSTLYLPIHYIAVTLLYLDLRVRHEALDLEWTAHQSAPVASASNLGVNISAPVAFAPIVAELSASPPVMDANFATRTPSSAQFTSTAPPIASAPMAVENTFASPISQPEVFAVSNKAEDSSAIPEYGFTGDSIVPRDTSTVPQPSGDFVSDTASDNVTPQTISTNAASLGASAPDYSSAPTDTPQEKRF